MANKYKKVKVNGKKGNFGTGGFCVEKIQEFIDASPSDPNYNVKKENAKKAADYLKGFFGTADETMEFQACAANMLWIT